MANFGVVASPAPLSDKPTWTMWPGGAYPGMKLPLSGGKRKTHKTRKSKKTRKSRKSRGRR